MYTIYVHATYCYTYCSYTAAVIVICNMSSVYAYEMLNRASVSCQRAWLRLLRNREYSDRVEVCKVRVCCTVVCLCLAGNMGNWNGIFSCTNR